MAAIMDIGLRAGLAFLMGAGVAERSRAEPARFRAVALSGAGSALRLRGVLGDRRYLDVLKINRIDFEHALRADTLIVPVGEFEFAALSPWPEHVAAADSIPKLMLISLRVQAFAAYERGRQVRWGPVSSGGPASPTPPGLYWANWKALEHVSTVDSTWVMRWCVNIQNRLGIAIHQYALTGRPASHCCIRLLEDDARWTYDWMAAWTLSDDGVVAVRGTPAIIFGRYEYEQPRPWRRLPLDPDATRMRQGELDDLVKGLETPP